MTGLEKVTVFSEENVLKVCGGCEGDEFFRLFPKGGGLVEQRVQIDDATGVVIGLGTVVHAGVKIGPRVTIHEHVFVGHGAVLEEGSTVRRSAWIGPGATVPKGHTVGPCITVPLNCTAGSNSDIFPPPQE